MERIDFKKENIPFTQVANRVLYDKNISMGAKALYAYFYSKPDGWQFSSERIGIELAISKPTVLGYIEELRKNGYLISQRLPNGRMLYKVIFPPLEPQSNNFTMAEPQSKKATVKKSHGEDSLPVSNKETIQVINNNTSNNAETSSAGILSSEVIKLMETVDPKNKTYYGNKTQRAASDFLLKEYGLEEVSKVIAILPKTNKVKYFPTITSPYELKEKWVKLRDELQKKKIELQEKQTKHKVAFH